MGHRDNERDDFREDGSGFNVLDILKKVQRQMDFLERKIDRLMEAIEGGSSRERGSFRFSGEHKSSYGPKDRKFSRGHARDDDGRIDGQFGEKGAASDKPYGRKSYGKSSGKPFGKQFGKSGAAKKKFSPSKKKI